MADRQWHGLMQEVLAYGEDRRDRTGVSTRALFGVQERFDLRAGFPLVTTKRMPWGGIAGELAAFLRGAESVEEFRRNGCKFWDGNAAAEYWLPSARFPGDVGRIYGVQWRKWRSVAPGKFVQVGDVRAEEHVGRMIEVDQLRGVVEALKKDPHGRRHVVTAWNPGEMVAMCLPPCHAFFQLYAADAGGPWLDLQFYMRSVDLFLGAPCDVATYALLQHVVANEVGRRPRFLTMTCGDAHVYKNHVDQAVEAMGRDARPLPQLRLAAGTTIDNFSPDLAVLSGYNPHPAILAPLNV